MTMVFECRRGLVKSNLEKPFLVNYVTKYFLQSGLGGTLWFSIGIIVDILLFPFLIHFLKTRAPGAKIFPQIAYARFGVTGHVMFCILAMTSSWHKHAARWKECSCVSTNDINNEFIFLVLTPSYSGHFIGGLGTTFYISYLKTTLSFLSVTSYFPSEESK
ncbi:LOW QUALITY PROTEIN: hypothetical protein MAR_023691 [Mya arenaria]|uniref:Uncharacterized protein n=1 Tax=Mya arenaria TaxID=6604 RepID=A0ABY7DQC7_MYAAR|nr:LOW QUALITY PROTEIN: hypothetical protein MAR_023691 [Mya arenaria]